MRTLLLVAAASLFSLALGGQAWAFNPQPDPPGKTKVTTEPNVNPAMHGTIAGHANVTVHANGAGVAADAGDSTCGTPVPGLHPHVNTMGAASAHCNANTHVQGAAT